jgi:hypothetical protein
MNLAANKCSYIILSENSKISNQSMVLYINNNVLNKEKSPKYLGVTLDPGQTFTNQVNIIKDKCNKKSNLLKYLKIKDLKISIKQEKLFIYQQFAQ